jgi:hypothetical protein
LGDEWVQFCLLWGPSLQRVDVEKASDEINEGNPVVHFYPVISKRLL